jgi:anti-sigma B factor antagonist
MDQTHGVAEESDGGSVVHSVTGEIDVAVAPTVRERLEQAVAEDGTLVVDLSGVSSIDSSALRVLIGTHGDCDSTGIEMRLVITEPRILKVFEITGLTDLFTIVPNVAVATKALGLTPHSEPGRPPRKVSSCE